MDDDRVGVGNVQSGLDDGGGHQHVNLFVDESKHNLLQLPLSHLPMGKFNHSPRHQLLHVGGHAVNIIDAVVHVIHLSAPGNFPLDGLPHQFFVIFEDVGLDGPPVHRRHFQHTHVPDARQAHVKRPRNRRRRQSQHIHIFFHLFDFFLLFYAEPLLLVDDEESQIFVLDTLGKHLVGANHNIHGSLFQRVLNLFRLLRRTETG